MSICSDKRLRDVQIKRDRVTQQQRMRTLGGI
jgi:hypothetical protein